MQAESRFLQLSIPEANKLLIRLLQNAHAGERAAANAYWGHGHSLFVRDKNEKAELLEIYHQEIHHRLRLKEMLQELGAKPRMSREILMYTVGFLIGFLCLFGGWFVPMYGAGKLESTNIVEYEVAARLAYKAGRLHLVDELLFFAEIEWDHEEYFFKKAAQHALFDSFPQWRRPLKRHLIQETFAHFKSSDELKQLFKKS